MTVNDGAEAFEVIRGDGCSPELPLVQSTLAALSWKQAVAFESRAAVVQTLRL